MPVSEREGYVPQKNIITVQVPKNIGNFVAEYRYNRASFDVTFDSAGGTGIPALHLYTGQVIPLWFVGKPEKKGAEFQGWKANEDLLYTDQNGEHTIPKGTVIKEADFPDGVPDAMPAKELVFTADWKEKEKADYTIQYYTESPYSGASTYEYVGAKIIKDADTGSEPDLDAMTPEEIFFPEVGEVVKSANGKFFVKFSEGGRPRPLERYYVRNVDKIEEDNKGDGPNGVKTVECTGDTVYKIYYDRQRYSLIFEKSNSYTKEARFAVPQPDGTEIQYDSDPSVNKPYTIKAKFGEKLLDWPSDNWVIDKETGVKYDQYRSTLGWMLNYQGGALWRDTPPYWLTSPDFIDKVDNPAKVSASTGKPLPPYTLSIGISQCSTNRNYAIYYMEYHFQGLDGGDERINNPDIQYTKIDTDSGYGHPGPNIPGFKLETPRVSRTTDVKENSVEQRKLESGSPNSMMDQLWGPEKELRPTEKQSHFWPLGLNDDLDELEDISDVPFDQIGQYVIAFKYGREKFRLQLDKDPTNTNGDAYFDGSDAEIDGKPAFKQVFYQKPLIDLDLNKEYPLKPEERPKSYPDTYVFKGWALDPAGLEPITDKDNKKKAADLEGQIQSEYDKISESEKLTDMLASRKKIEKLKGDLEAVQPTMPRYTKTIYAMWGEPDFEWKVKFDPNGGELAEVKDTDIATHKAGDPITTTEGKFGPQKYVMPEKQSNEGDMQVFKVSHRMSIKPPKAPTRVGYDFMGWEFVRYDKNGKLNDYFSDHFKLPELYAYGNEVVSDLHLRAIWVKNPGADIRDVKPLPVGLLDTTQELHYFAGKSVHAGTEGVLYAKSLLDINPYAPIECAVLPASDKVKAQNKIAA